MEDRNDTTWDFFRNTCINFTWGYLSSLERWRFYEVTFLHRSKCGWILGGTFFGKLPGMVFLVAWSIASGNGSVWLALISFLRELVIADSTREICLILISLVICFNFLLGGNLYVSA